MTMPDWQIAEITADKRAHMALLLLADEQESMIDRYLDAGRMFALRDRDGVQCVAVVVALDDHTCELKNIAAEPLSQRRGYGRAMVAYLLDLYLPKYDTMFVGTGEVPSILRFYERCGFRISHRVEGFFTDNYDAPMVEEGILLRDMVYLRAGK